MKNFATYIFIILLTIIGLNYFYATFLPEIFKAIRLLFLGILILIGLYYSDFFTKNDAFSVPIKLIIFSMFFSVLMAFLTWDQPIPIGFLIMTPYALWSIYFLLKKIKIPIPTIENVAIILSLAYAALYFYQFANPSNVMFNVGNVEDEFVEYRNIIRIIFPGVGIFWLGVYISLTKFSLEHNLYKKIFWLVLIVLGVVIPTMEATRTHLVPTLMVFLFHFFRKISFFKLIIAGVIIFSAGIIVPNLDIPVIQGMIEQTESQKANTESDIRYLASKHFLTEFSPYTINYIFGNGMGHGRSAYGQHLIFLAKQKGYHISDVGIIGVLVLFGVFYLFGWSLLGFQIFVNKINNRYIYVKYYFFNILFGIITGSTLYHVNYMITTVFALYIFQQSLNIERKRKIINKLKELLKKSNEDKLISSK